MKEERKMPTQEQETEWLAELARDRLRFVRCPHCNYLTVHGYLCMKCGEDTGK